MNNVVEPALGDDTGQQFDTLGAKFKADVMSTAKNVRNVYEFKAITGNVPTAGQTPETRAKLLAQMKTQILQNLKRNQVALDLMQKGATPDSAWKQATDEADKITVAEPKKAKTDLIKGTVYKDAKGNRAMWDGTKFVPAP